MKLAVWAKNAKIAGQQLGLLSLSFIFPLLPTTHLS